MNFWSTLPRPFTVLAPMEDVTDSVFRLLIASCGRPHVFFTEFTSSDGMNSPGREAVIHRLEYTEGERPLVAQIWGNNPENYRKAARELVAMGFDGIDINMGCPVSKIIRQGHCSGLIEDKPLAKELVLAAIEGAGAVPVSVKTRLGFRQLETEEWAGHLLELPIAALTIHGRTAKQLSQGPANWEEIGKVVALRNAMRKDTLVIGNGDVLSLAEAQQKYQEYGVDGVMIGRGVFQNPFVFGGGPVSDIRELSTAGKLDLLLAHARAFCARWGSGRRIGVLKKFFKIYVRDFSGASDLRVQLMEAQSLAELESVIQRFLGQSAESSSDVFPPRPLA